MKTTKLSVLLGFIMLMAFVACPALFAADTAKQSYASVDIAKVFDNYQKTKDNDRTLQESGKKKEQERDGLVHQIRQMKDELNLVTDDARAKKEEKLELKVRELQDFDQTAKRDLGEKRSEVVKQIFQDIDDTIKRYGERKGIDLVFNEKVLLYYNPKYDVTADVLTELNGNYAKKKK